MKHGQETPESAPRPLSPATYAEWCGWFERFGRGEDAALDAMERHSFEFGPVIAERFAARMSAALTQRKQAWLDALNRSIQTSAWTPGSLGVLLTNARRHLHPLIRVATLDTLPASVKESLWKDLDRMVTDVRTSLKSQIERQASGREQNLLSLSQFHLDKLDIPGKPLPSAGDTTTGEQPPSAEPVPKRRIIL